MLSRPDLSFLSPDQAIAEEGVANCESVDSLFQSWFRSEFATFMYMGDVRLGIA